MTRFYDYGEFADVSVGDVIQRNGKRYRLTRKGRWTVCVERYYWFDALAETVARTFGKIKQGE